ncbi:hypothetical protein BY996DRAFT_4574744 [Phakopsora pachyrhizi]|uniref:DUF7872 domain-containing protein n=1 Tax=Phakopsora pachyrhizi TaxID=170000 RepID=A0AAV0AFQ4_PHAPC|nr:hypothetical protein BY996DRAFT_4587844 [Phakopsora pachyrhizi]KAI8460384.1 hypothetical protein BY996DRAFT_4574744 [Phakopsora pachyrhizi]CAH7666782.1 hypothetical protein PPACK8108_LOCUS1134 [Phakopsora pachyrhizi]
MFRVLVLAFVLAHFNFSVSKGRQLHVSSNYEISSASEGRNCTKYPLNQELWGQLNLNKYLHDYPDGQKINLLEINMTNFICAIGHPCNAGQLCSSVGAPDWYIFVATQNWNQLMNVIYNSISFGIGAIRDISPTMLQDLWPDRDMIVEATASFLALAGAFTACIPASLFPGIGVWIWVAVQGAFFTTVSEIWFYNNNIRNSPNMDSLFTKWTDFAVLLSELEDGVQEKFSNYTQRVVSSPISSEDGLYGALKDGTFLQRTQENMQFTAQDKVEQIFKLKLLNAILRAQGYYITRASDPCDSRSSKTLPEDKNILSYCGEDNVMMSIVKASGSKTKKKVFHGSLIQSKYGFSTEFLTKSAWKCQTKYGQYEYDPYKNRKFSPLDINADCLFNLPVCDCSREEIAVNRKKGMRTVTACLEAGVPVHPPPKIVR